MSHGSRPVTKRDRDLAIKRELLATKSPITLTPGMIRHLRERRSRLSRLRAMVTSWSHPV